MADDDDDGLMDYFRKNMKEFKAWRDEHEGSDEELAEIRKELLANHRSKKAQLSNPENTEPPTVKPSSKNCPSKDDAGAAPKPKTKRWI